jgi:hypothetical protein
MRQLLEEFIALKSVSRGVSRVKMKVKPMFMLIGI